MQKKYITYITNVHLKIASRPIQLQSNLITEMMY